MDAQGQLFSLGRSIRSGATELSKTTFHHVSFHFNFINIPISIYFSYKNSLCFLSLHIQLLPFLNELILSPPLILPIFTQSFTQTIIL